MAAPGPPTQSPGANNGAAPTQLPEWEVPGKKGKQQPMTQRFSRPKSGTSLSLALSRRFDRVFPPNRTYLRLRRRTFLFALLAVIIALLALIIGLAVGLTRNS